MMKPRAGNTTSVLVWTLVLALALGFAVGSFSAASRARAAVKAAEDLASGIAPAPVVTAARYDKEEGALVLRVLNPGLVPVQIVDQSLAFKPGEQSKQSAYVLAALPLNVEVAPLSELEVQLKLKPGSQDLAVGDVLAATVTFTHPFSQDLYALTHVFEVSKAAASGKEIGGSAQPGLNAPKKGGK